MPPLRCLDLGLNGISTEMSPPTGLKKEQKLYTSVWYGVPEGSRRSLERHIEWLWIA
ncbi:MAG: hypothetical protein OXI61_15170 [Candidatus Poribacteria bacterium]|nr:hypothetical protein [Candidatus Poribacteria bacterium]